MNTDTKVAVVTGASSGIGKEVALRLGKQKARVALLARRESNLENIAAKIKKYGGEALPLKTDITEEKKVKNAIESTVNAYGRIDMLVNVAGLGIFKPVEKMSYGEWSRQIDVMLTGSFLVTHHALPHIYRLEKGKVIFVTSLWGPVKTAPECSAYNAAKAGVSALADSLREEVREKGMNIGVTEVRPGTVATEFFEKADYKGGPDPDRVLSADDVAEVILNALNTRHAAAHNVIELEGANPPY